MKTNAKPKIGFLIFFFFIIKSLFTAKEKNILLAFSAFSRIIFMIHIF